MAAGQEELGKPPVEIRVLRTLEEYGGALALQREVWGFSDVDQVPPRLMGVARFVGGLVLGAYDGGRMVGFSLALPGMKPDGKSYWHSHMTGVLPSSQNRGIGKRLKLCQREEALRSHVDLIEWTFDPLEIKNSHFNLERLGVIARRYVPNLYGITSSPLHGALPTDRLVAEWDVQSGRVRSLVEGGSAIDKRVTATVEIPAAITGLRTKDASAALAIQNTVREQFERHFADGLAVVGYERTQRGGLFQLGPLNEPPR